MILKYVLRQAMAAAQVRFAAQSKANFPIYLRTRLRENLKEGIPVVATVRELYRCARGGKCTIGACAAVLPLGPVWMILARILVQDGIPGSPKFPSSGRHTMSARKEPRTRARKAQRRIPRQKLHYPRLTIYGSIEKLTKTGAKPQGTGRREEAPLRFSRWCRVCTVIRSHSRRQTSGRPCRRSRNPLQAVNTGSSPQSLPRMRIAYRQHRPISGIAGGAEFRVGILPGRRIRDGRRFVPLESREHRHDLG